MSKLPENILQAGCTAYAKEFLNGNGTFGEGIEAAYFAINEHEDWVRAGPKAWDGEGLPGRGTKCECRPWKAHDAAWVEVEFIASWLAPNGQTYSWVSTGYGWLQPQMLRFRAIRTPEQIAAEEREKTLNDIVQIMSSVRSTAGGMSAEAESLYDAGYRKQSEP